jgi:hypothetical protein
MALFTERFFPLFGALIAAGVYLYVPTLRNHVFPDTVPNLLSALVSVGGIAVGFLATVKSILISVDDRPIVKRMKDADLYHRVMGYLRAAMRWSFALAIFSAAALVVDYRGLQAWNWWYAGGTAVWLFLVTGSVLSYLRVSRIWATLLTALDSPTTT